MMYYILRAKNRVGYEKFEPESICAWNVEPQQSEASLELWESVFSMEELEQLLSTTVPFKEIETTPEEKL